MVMIKDGVTTVFQDKQGAGHVRCVPASRDRVRDWAVVWAGCQVRW